MTPTPEPVDATLLVETACLLGEGVQWRGDVQRLVFTDIHGRRLLSCDADGGDLDERALPERLGAFAFDPDGAMLCAFESGLFRFDPDSGERERLTAFEPDQPTTRLNDGRCDRQGRFLVGGIDEDGLRPLSSLIRYRNGAQETLFDGVGCSNALCFAPDGRVMYHASSEKPEIWAYAYDPDTGALGDRQLFARVQVDGAGPDGACVDADGNLWNAEFNGFGVQQHLRGGGLGLRVRLPVPQVTCCCFGGPNLDRLYITTARENMTAEQVAEHPLSGALFVAEVGVRGLPEDGFAERLF